MHDLGLNYILSLNKLRTTNYGLSSFSYVAAKLRNAAYLILSVPLSLLVLKENPRPHFVQPLFFLINISLNIMYLLCICICYVF